MSKIYNGPVHQNENGEYTTPDGVPLKRTKKGFKINPSAQIVQNNAPINNGSVFNQPVHQAGQQPLSQAQRLREANLILAGIDDVVQPQPTNSMFGGGAQTTRTSSIFGAQQTKPTGMFGNRQSKPTSMFGSGQQPTGQYPELQQVHGRLLQMNGLIWADTEQSVVVNGNMYFGTLAMRIVEKDGNEKLAKLSGQPVSRIPSNVIDWIVQVEGGVPFGFYQASKPASTSMFGNGQPTQQSRSILGSQQPKPTRKYLY